MEVKYHCLRFQNIGGDAKEYDIWGGDEKPKKWAYLLVSIGKKINVISVFRSKAEAMSWIGHTA